MSCVKIQLDFNKDIDKDKLVQVYFERVMPGFLDPCSQELFNEVGKTINIRDAIFDTLLNGAVVSALEEEVAKRERAKKVKRKSKKSKGRKRK